MSLTLLLEMANDGFGDRPMVGRRSEALTTARVRDLARARAWDLTVTGATCLVYVGATANAFPVAMFAAAYAGIPLVPLNYRLSAQQLRGLIAKHPGAAFITDPGGLPALDDSTGPCWSTEDWLRPESNPGPEWTGVDAPAAPAVVVYTSGTTSEPKGVLLRPDKLMNYVLGSVEFASAGADEAALMSVPPYHIAAVANVLTNLFAGRRLIVLDRFSADEWLDTARAEEVTNALVVPTMLARILDSQVAHDIPSLRTLAYGGAPMPSRLIETALRTWPHLDFVNAYGLTETSSTVALLGPEDHRRAIDSLDPAVRARLSSVGRPLPGIELEIRGPGGDRLPAGERGRIFVRGGQVSAEYAGIGRVVDAAGFFDTRDEGYFDDEGYLFIGGRSDDTIIRGAENIAPAEIEEVLLQYPGIDDAAVVGLPDEEWGQRIVAVLVGRGQNVDGDELRSFVTARLRSSKTPDIFLFSPELPRTPTGKLIRRDVLEQVLRGSSQATGPEAAAKAP